ncbi:hypothetical protein QYE76_063995 [Lolium multiflorum]|uniref:Pentatricopeptide repeat-containing protein n=1 Tax=Lolium multiflorum TaxID=4521 RepID=A0AAD8W8R1_LOLMU|nr:hypothetical protein QYE76_063995 [Lolium multiflorum]
MLVLISTAPEPNGLARPLDLVRARSGRQPFAGWWPCRLHYIEWWGQWHRSRGCPEMPLAPPDNPPIRVVQCRREAPPPRPRTAVLAMSRSASSSSSKNKVNAHRLSLYRHRSYTYRSSDYNNATSYNTIIKSLCEDSTSQRALDLLRTVSKEGCGCFPDVVAYSTVIHGFFKEGEIGKACDLLHETIQQGIVPNVVTYISVIDALCKARAMDKSELFLKQMVDNNVQLNNVT